MERVFKFYKKEFIENAKKDLTTTKICGIIYTYRKEKMSNTVGKEVKTW